MKTGQSFGGQAYDFQSGSVDMEVDLTLDSIKDGGQTYGSRRRMAYIGLDYAPGSPSHPVPQALNRQAGVREKPEEFVRKSCLHACQEG